MNRYIHTSYIPNEQCYPNGFQSDNYIQTLQVPKCRTILVERTYTAGFIVDASQVDGVGSFTPTLTISYPPAPNATVSIVEVRAIGTDTCVRDIILDANGTATISDYAITDTHMIYVMLKSVIVGGTTIQCCTALDYVNCPTSNYILFTVTDIGNIQFLSNPSGAQIWIAPIGQTPTDTGLVTPNTISDLLIGDYDYILKLTNYNNYISTQPITVIKSQTAVVGPINLVPTEGCIYFISSPSGARVYLAPVGQTPIDTGIITPNIICGKPLGDYTYKLTLTGYEDKTGTVALVSGHGEIISDTLRGLPVLIDIIISPLNPSVAVNTDQQFSATPLDQYSNPIAATVTWSSSNTYVGIIDPNTGMFSALHTGTTVITAYSGTISKTTTVTVTPTIPVLTTIIVSPATTSIVEGTGTIFTASTLDQFNNPISVTIIWSSSNPTVGTISQNGVFQAISQGTTVITASSGGISGVALANVTAIPPPPVVPVLARIVVSPSTLSIQKGNSSIFTASTLDQFGNHFPTTVTWTSSNPSVGTIDPTTGVFTAISEGTTVITASSNEVIGIALASVTTGPPVQAGIFPIGAGLEPAAFMIGLAMFASALLTRQAPIRIVSETR